jgi:hypothetical protein
LKQQRFTVEHMQKAAALLTSQNKHLKRENEQLRASIRLAQATDDVLRSTRPQGLRAADQWVKAFEQLRKSLANKVQTARAERDEARRMYCRMYADWVDNDLIHVFGLEEAALIVAHDLGWKCFDTTPADDGVDEGCVAGKEAKDGTPAPQ